MTAPRSASPGGRRNAALVFGAFLLIGVFVTTWFPWRERTYAREALEHKAENQASLIAYTIAPGIEFGDADMVQEVFRGAARDVDFVGVVAEDANGSVIRSGETDGGPDTIVVSEPIESMGRPLGTLRLTMSTARLDRQSRERFVASAAIGALILALGAMVSFWVARSIRRIASLTNETARALAVAQQAEIKSRFLANMSHEIQRGPLAREHSALTVCDTLMSTCRSRGLELVLEVEPNVPKSVIGDRLRFEQVLTNLVGNALKFTPQGRVTIALSWDGELRAAVRDTGIGIPRDKLDTIFEAFSQADASTTRRFGGTGLGLTISRELVKKMGGELSVTSVDGEGSTFSFFVKTPLDVAAEPTALESPPAAIVVASDDVELARVVTAYAARHALPVERCAPADLERRLERASPEHVVVVVWDVRLPAPDETVRNALRRAIAEGRARVLVHASVVDDASIEGVSAGALPRPFSRETFARAIERGAERAADALPASRIAKIDPRLRILVAEDDETNRLVVDSFLAELGLRAEMVVNGRIAVERIRSGDYDLVLMDCQMPELDGYGATREVREWEAASGHAPTPIIAVTAHSFEEERARALAAGMNGYVTKPLTLATFVAAVRELLPHAVESAEEETVAAAPRAPGSKARIAEAFRRSADEAITSIAESIARRDWKALAQHAHRLKGSSLSVGATEAAALAARLEEQAAAEDEPGAGEVAVQLEMEIVEAEERLRASA